jgi:hypothetical protein
MDHVLDKYDKEIHFFSDPFPHIIIEDCLDEDLYNLMADNFPDNDSFSPKVKKENQLWEKSYMIVVLSLLRLLGEKIRAIKRVISCFRYPLVLILRPTLNRLSSRHTQIFLKNYLTHYYI